MPKTYRRAAKVAKSPTDDLIGKRRSCHRWFEPVIDDLRLIFPHKCSTETAYHSGRSVRVCEIWLSGKGAPDGAALAALLRSPIGDRVHAALIRGVTLDWADNFRSVSEISKLRKEQAASNKRLAALEQGIR